MAPVVRLDWTIGTYNCSLAKNSKTYACLDQKSICIDLDKRKGYLCSCVQGYNGNPYLPGGCKTISSSIAKSGCLDQCGKISIPFPFGVGPNFDVVCNTTTNPEKPYLRALSTELVELNSSKIVVHYNNLASTCYNLSAYQMGITKPEERKLIIDLLKTQFSFSDDNWITAIGCNAIVVGVSGEDSLTSIQSSCAAICPDSVSYNSASCSFGRTYLEGTGCCRVPIPRGTSYLEANLSDLTGRWPRTNFSCSYAFIEYMDRNIYSEDRYLCNCSNGYRGNPYLNQGCQDIDECADNTTNTCILNSICENDVGSYHCSCPKGYIGDGRKDGTGCIRRPPSKTKAIILIGLGSGLGFLLLLLIYKNASTSASSDTHPLMFSSTI
ncbi:hypothetical protein AAHA92_33133 [Salvia divinorum]|uniref:EGF-like domain-containing protein n=1 Tax=Salvia divinorum TaxID=28513 RepID=A0ABD1FR24_SALDI